MEMKLRKLEPHQQRVMDEERDLQSKIVALGKFIGGEIFAGLEQAEQHRLVVQLHVMQQYRAILRQRIEAF